MYENRVVGRENRAAAVTEDGIDAFIEEDLNDDLSAGRRGFLSRDLPLSGRGLRRI
jgi:hypothetical protein